MCNMLLYTKKHEPYLISFLILILLLTFVKPQPAETLVKNGDVINIPLLNYSVVTSPGKVVDEFVDISPNSTVSVIVSNIPTDAAFVLLQTHAYLYEITLSYNAVLAPHFYVNGSNVGLVQQTAGKGKAEFFIYNPISDTHVTVLIAVQAYGDDAPIPGGCNMEFEVEISPYLRITETESFITVRSQPPTTTTLIHNCEFPSTSEVLMYHMYLPEMDFSSETYFRALKAMMTVDGLKNHGILTEPPVVGSDLQRTYNAYRGTGTVYGAVAALGFSGSAYVPAITYSCNGQTNIDSCDTLTTVVSKILCATAFFLGILTCFFGHRFFRTEMFLSGFLAAGIVAYILLAFQNTMTTPVVETVSVILGLLFGIMWLLLWFFCGVPVISIFLPSMTLGFLMASVAMYATLADIHELENDANFWAAFICIMLAVLLVCPPVMSKTNIISCAVLGGYATIIPVDYYIGSNLKYIILNTIRRATVSGYNVAIIDPPFQFRDTILVALWISLSVLGSTAQIWQQRGKPPFPPRPCVPGIRRLADHLLSSHTPLLIDARIPYGTVTEPITDPTPATEERFTFLPKMPRISFPVRKV